MGRRSRTRHQPLIQRPVTSVEQPLDRLRTTNSLGVLAIPSKRFTRALVQFLVRPEVDALLAAPDRRTWFGRRDHAFILMAVQTGLRLSEITGPPLERLREALHSIKTSGVSSDTLASIQKAIDISETVFGKQLRISLKQTHTKLSKLKLPFDRSSRERLEGYPGMAGWSPNYRRQGSREGNHPIEPANGGLSETRIIAGSHHVAKRSPATGLAHRH